MTEFWRALVDFQHREVLVVALCEAANDRERDIARCPRPVRSYSESEHSLPRGWASGLSDQSLEITSDVTAS
jgi:hypothetical protein